MGEVYERQQAIMLSVNLPLQPPLAPMLAKLQTDIPSGPGWTFEPKWDGFRAIVFRAGDECEITSRDKRSLVRYFPELPPVLKAALPDRCIVDGEIIMTGPDGLDFDLLQLRLHPAESRVRKLAAEYPASYVAFDLLALDDANLCKERFDKRRGLLETHLAGVASASFDFLRQPRAGSAVMLTPQTADPDLARQWYDELEAIHLEGLVAKLAEQPYSFGERSMVKIKHRRSVDCVVGGYRTQATGEGLGALLLGLYDAAGTLHYVGHTSSFSRAAAAAVLDRLRPLEGEGGFGGGRTPGGLSRWSSMRKNDAAWVSLRPELVCEISFDYLQGDRFRHAARFERWRDDKLPRECTFDQLGVSGTPVSA